MAAQAGVGDGLIVEVDRDAAKVIDAKATERLVTLETADIEVPPPAFAAGRRPLYFRILVASAVSLRVELWELGAPRAAKSVSSIGSPQLRARRIALAAAELARQLRRKRLAELSSRPAPAREKGSADAAAGAPIHGSVGWDAAARGASIGWGGGYVVGPTARAVLRLGKGPRVSLGASWLAGETTDGPPSPLRWLEVELGLGYAFALGKRVELELGAQAAAASVRVSELAEGASPPPLDEWSARVAFAPRFAFALGRSVALVAGPELGVVLRPVRGVDGDGASRRLGGAWLGATAGVELRPF